MKAIGSLIQRGVAAAAFVALTAAPAAAQQTPSPTATTTPKPGPPWTQYMAYGTIAIGVLVLMAVVVGFMVQAPGFRRGKRGQPGGVRGTPPSV